MLSRPGSAAAGRHLLERAPQIERLEDALAGAAAGDGRMLAIVGPAGIGKSSLLAVARRLARERGLRVLAASGSELERGFAFGVCRQLFEPVLTNAGAAERGALLDGAAAIGGRLLLAAPPIDASTDGALAGREPREASFAQLHGLYWLAANLADQGPVVIAVDDAHWADLPSLRLLNYLARRLEGLPIVAIVAARDAHPVPDGALLRSLLDAPEVDVCRPDPLSEPASAVLIRQALGSDPAPEFASACQRATRGNPFYLEELLRALRSARIAPTARAAGRVEEVGPPAVSREVLGRIAHLDPECAVLARALAVLGGRADLRDAAALAGLDEAEAARAADALSRAAVLRGGVPPAFSHPIVQAAVYEDIAPHERARVHHRAAALLADRACPVSEVAAHLLRTPPARDAWTLARLRAAAEQALEEGAIQAAIEYLRRALSERPPPVQRFELTIALGSALADDRDPEGVDLLRAAAGDAPDAAARARAAMPLASALVYIGRAGEATEVLEQAIAALGDASGARPPAARLEALLHVMGITGLEARRRLRGRLADAAERARRAPREVAEPLLAPLAIELAFSGATADEVAGLAGRALGEGELLREAPALSPLPYVAAYALICAGRPSVAERSLDEALDRATRHGNAGGVVLACAARSLARLHRGDLRGAEADAETCLRLGAHGRQEIALPLALATLVAVRLERGEPERGRAVLASPAATALDLGGVLTQPLVESRARLRLAEGDQEGGLLELERCRDWAAAWGEGSGSWPVQWRSRMALAERRRGDSARGRELAREDVELARRFGAARPLGRSLVALGLCEGGDRGIALMHEAVTALEASEDRLEHARALVELGAALRRGGARAAARDPLAAGMRVARGCGATALTERAYEELRATGARPPKILHSGLDALTASELRVARMAAEGMTNRGIAQSLFVTRKTVEAHLSHAYQKLGIASRSELPSALADGAAEPASGVLPRGERGSPRGSSRG